MSSFDERLDPQILKALNERGTSPQAKWSPHPDVTWSDVMIAGEDGAPDIRIGILQKRERNDIPAPAIYYMHGSGFISGTYADGMDIWEQTVLETGAVVFSVEYRLAPDNPFPAGFNDCYTGLKWLQSSVDEYRVDLNKIVIAGGSAGANLAAAVALKARDDELPKLYYQFLIFPMLDDRAMTHSAKAITDERVFNANGLKYSYNMYLGENRENVSPYAAPARATDLSNLPPTYIYVEELDPVRDEAIEYAVRLMQAGVSTELHVFPGLYHAAMFIHPHTDVAKRASAQNYAFFRRIFAVEG